MSRNMEGNDISVTSLHHRQEVAQILPGRIVQNIVETVKIKFEKGYLLELFCILLHKSSIYFNCDWGESRGSNKVKSRIAVSSQLLIYRREES